MARNAAAHAGAHVWSSSSSASASLFGLVAIGGTWKPALGLDLQGGTRITLTANGNPTQENLEEAAAIIDDRVNGSGFSEAEVTTQGNQYIVVEVPGDTDNRCSTPSSARRSCGSARSPARAPTRSGDRARPRRRTRALTRRQPGVRV